MPFLEKRFQKTKRYAVLQLERQSKQNTTPSGKYDFTFREKQQWFNYSTKCEVNLLYEIQEIIPQMHTISPKTDVGRQETFQKPSIKPLAPDFFFNFSTSCI
jgi:hypothetical protein